MFRALPTKHNIGFLIAKTIFRSSAEVHLRTKFNVNVANRTFLEHVQIQLSNSQGICWKRWHIASNEACDGRNLYGLTQSSSCQNQRVSNSQTECWQNKTTVVCRLQLDQCRRVSTLICFCAGHRDGSRAGPRRGSGGTGPYMLIRPPNFEIWFDGQWISTKEHRGPVYASSNDFQTNIWRKRRLFNLPPYACGGSVRCASGALYCFSFAIFLAHTHIQTHSIIEIPSQVMNQLHCKAERFTRIRILGNGVLGASSVRTVAQRRLHSIYDKFQQH